MKENNFIFLKQTSELSYDKERDGNLFIKGPGNTQVGKYVIELHLIREK